MTAMTPEEDGILRRWARRKQVARSGKPEPAEPPLEIPPAAETIDLGEIAGWLKRNVPPAWKTAALRRLWVADPAIRNFVEMADYAWDWNTPGGAPGYGPMRAADNVADLLRRIIATPEPAAPAEPEASPPAPAPALARPAEPPRIAATPVPVTAEPPAADTPPPRRRGGKATPV